MDGQIRSQIEIQCQNRNFKGFPLKKLEYPIFP